MKPKVCLETTIPNYLAARRSSELLVASNQKITWDWWETRRHGFDLYVSEFVLDEIKLGNPLIAARRAEIITGISMLVMNGEIMTLANDLVEEDTVPEKAKGDAVHVAIASAHECEFLLTWNCRHIANAQRQKGLRRVVAKHGYELPNICTPLELMGEEYFNER